jgi:hypothetical protein
MATPVPDQTTAWKTYKNEKYGYTLKYPESWQVSSLPGTDVATFHEPLLSSSCEYDKGQLCTSIFILAATYNPEAKIYEGDIVFEPGIEKVTNEVVLKLDNDDARGFEWRQGNYGQGGRLQYVVTAVHKDNKYTIMFEERKKGKEFTRASDWENKAILDQILSTFKFLGRNTPEAVTEDFYNWYFACLQNHFKNPAEKSPQEDCPYSSQKSISQNLVQTLASRVGYDPVLCAQDLPSRIAIDKATISNEMAEVAVHAYYEVSGDNSITVNLRLIEDTWKISNITCQKR